MEIWTETVMDRQANWPTTLAMIAFVMPPKWSHKHQQNTTNVLNTIESFISFLQIPEDLTHDKLNMLQQL